MAKSKAKELTVTLMKSPCGRLQSHRDCVRGLGLRRLRHTVTVADTPAVRGMIAKVYYMLRVEET
ncbi:MAG: 50S ribosomal protein L30 [Gammaproteobacteria bacterium]|nr:50S ribosomal protein L30 [Gammaproteobacteria bacterium]